MTTLGKKKKRSEKKLERNGEKNIRENNSKEIGCRSTALLLSATTVKSLRVVGLTFL